MLEKTLEGPLDIHMTAVQGGVIRNIIEVDRESRHFWHKSRSVHEFIIKIQENICMLQILGETSRKNMEWIQIYGPE